MIRILAGDIGGTRTRLWIAECAGTECRPQHKQEVQSRSYTGLVPILDQFLRHAPEIDAVCLGIAGPIRETPSGQRVNVTNLPWTIEGRVLADTFGFTRVRLINDFQAVGYGIEALQEDDFLLLQAGEPVVRAPRATIGAGSGLGQGLLIWQQDHYEAIATEGGHADFGPTDSMQIKLTRFLHRTAGHAAYEKILSGPGLVRLYMFLREQGVATETDALAEAMAAGDPAAAVTRAALAGHDDLANHALDLFVSIYGAQAGNLALSVGALGGVYIAGGIAPRISTRLADGRFMRSFCNKGKMSGLATAIPVRVILNEDVGLMGAATAGARMVSGMH